MRLVIAAEIFSPDIGGPATYAELISQELVKRGHHIKLICYSDRSMQNQFNFPVYRIVRSKIKLWHYLKYFLRLLFISINADCIYAQGPVSSGFPSVIIGKILRKRVVVKVVGDYAWEQSRNSGKTNAGIDEFQSLQLTGKILKLKQKEIYVSKQAHRVIVPSEYLKKIVIGWGVSSEKIIVIYNSFNAFKPLSSKPDKNVLISIGRLVPWKGFEMLIRSMPYLLKINGAFRLKIIGDGPEKERLQNIIAALNLERYIMIRSLTHDDAMRELQTSGIFILNSGYEGLSHTILEALSLQVPVIASRIGGNPELIRDRHNGLLVDYNDKEQIVNAIIEAYKDETSREKFAENSKEIIKKFSFEKMTVDTIKILQR